jgi:hypothetical protein
MSLYPQRLDAPPATIELPAERAGRRPVNARSVLLGVVGVVYLSSLSFYNNAVVSNTVFLGSFFPIGLLLFFLALVGLINAPLHRWAPRRALSGGELAVVLSMMLVACAVPGAQMQYLLGHLVSPWQLAAENTAYQRALETMDLPDALFPTFDDKDVLARARDPVVQYYVARTPRDADSFLVRLRAVPWGAWVRPLLTWGLFFVSFFGALLCLGLILRRQWVENERLPFPLATMYASLIETPEPGHTVNRLLRARAFWVAFVIVFVIHALNALNTYAPRYWPLVPLKYDLTNILTDPPWLFMERRIHSTRVYFAVVGVTYFVQSRIAFSIWFFILFWQIPRMAYGMMGKEWTHVESADQSIGATTVYALFILVLGRHHWMAVLRRMVGAATPRDPQDAYLPYGPAGWAMVLCFAGMAAWLRAAGANWPGTILLLVMFFTIFLVLLRVVAETGLFFVQFWTVPHRPWTELMQMFPGWGHERSALRTTYFTCVVGTILAVSQRENLVVHTMHGLRVTDLQVQDQPPPRRPRWGLVTAMIGALALAYVVSAASTLYCEYNYSATLDRKGESPINNWVMTVSSHVGLREASYQAQYGTMPPQAFDSAGYFAVGAGITLALSILTARYSWWPLHPVGYVLVNAFTTYHSWLSILIGWLAKTILLRLGGVSLFRAAQPFFIGLVLGECGAAGFWLFVALVRLNLALDYHAIQLLPG